MNCPICQEELKYKLHFCPGGQVESDIFKNSLTKKTETGAKLACSDVLLLKLLEEMRTETVECLWDHADTEDLDKQPCVSMTARLEDFFNLKIYDIKRKQ